jgi:hypothetical protein
MPAPRTDIRSSDAKKVVDARGNPDNWVVMGNKLPNAMIKGRYEYGGPPRGKGWQQSQGDSVGSGGGGGSSGSRPKESPARGMAASIVKKRKDQKGSSVARAMNG